MSEDNFAKIYYDIYTFYRTLSLKDSSHKSEKILSEALFEDLRKIRDQYEKDYELVKSRGSKGLFEYKGVKRES